MSLKLNIRKDLEDELEDLIPLTQAQSKTEYINNAIELYNLKIKREQELKKLKTYFKSYSNEAKTILNEFSKVRINSN